MQALRSALRRRLPLRQPLFALRRPRTDGPHKEYFQTPGQSPVPDTTPYNPSEPIQSFPAAGSSWTVRALRTLLWATLFGVLGAGAGVGLITWEYLQPPFEPGSPEDTELFEEIAETLNSHPVAEDLREDNWIEENFYTARPHQNQSLNLIHDNLTGTRGLTIKAFRHPTLQYTLLLVFAGFSVEGWPDVVHGGVTASLMLEGAQRHLNNHYSMPNQQPFSLDDTGGDVRINLDYKKPLRPGEIYAVVCPPAGIENAPAGASGNQATFRIAALVMRLEAAPRLGSEFDPVSNVETHTMEIPSTGGHDLTHAIGTIEIAIVPITEEGETAQRIPPVSNPLTGPNEK